MYWARKAFSLIESAIVLGVVGLVIGGIWVAAATVRENMLANDIAQGLLYIKNEMQSQILVSQVPLTMQDSLWGALPSTASKLNLAPADWVQSNGKIVTPSGQGLTIGTFDSTAWELSGVGVPSGSIGFGMAISSPANAFSPSLCVKVLTKWLAADGQNWARINGNPVYRAPASNRDITHSVGYCNANGSYTISSVSFWFSLSRTQ